MIIIPSAGNLQQVPITGKAKPDSAGNVQPVPGGGKTYNGCQLPRAGNIQLVLAKHRQTTGVTESWLGVVLSLL